MNLLDRQQWNFPIPIAYGPGLLSEIHTFCHNANINKPLIVTEKSTRNLPFIEDILQTLRTNNIECDIYSDISSNPRDDEIRPGRTLFRNGQHDGIIAIGGGSGMDAGKAICTVANNEIDLWKFEFKLTPPDVSETPFPPVICIPTTAGTGAETTSAAMITLTSRNMKLCTWHPDLIPSVALLDPNITLGLPTDLTAWTGCDAMVHAIEAYCVPGFDSRYDEMALDGLRLINQWISIAVNDPSNIEARGGMIIAACRAGIAFTRGLGLVHSISHMVGGEYDTHHGLTNAIVLPSVLNFNADHITDKVPAMAAAMNLTDKSFDGFYQAVCQILDDVGIPKKLHDIGVPLDCAPMIARRAFEDDATPTNPRQANVTEIENLIDNALTTGR